MKNLSATSSPSGGHPKRPAWGGGVQPCDGQPSTAVSQPVGRLDSVTPTTVMPPDVPAIPDTTRSKGTKAGSRRGTSGSNPLMSPPQTPQRSPTVSSQCYPMLRGLSQNLNQGVFCDAPSEGGMNSKRSSAVTCCPVLATDSTFIGPVSAHSHRRLFQHIAIRSVQQSQTQASSPDSTSHLPNKRARLSTRSGEADTCVPGTCSTKRDDTFTIDESLPPKTSFAWGPPSSGRQAPYRIPAGWCLYVVHVVAFLALASTDLVHYAGRFGMSKFDTFNPVLCLALVVLYGILAVGLMVSAMARPPAFPSGSHRRWEWLAFAILHTGAAFVSAWWRGSEEPGIRAACVVGLMQLFLAALYAVDIFGSAILSLVSILVLAGLEVSLSTAMTTVIDNMLLMCLAGVASICAIGNASPMTGRQKMYYEAQLEQLKLIFQLQPRERSANMHADTGSRPPEVSTHLDQIVERLQTTKENLALCTLDRDISETFASFFSNLLNELTNLSSLHDLSLTDLEGSSPMTIEYVRKTLNQCQGMEELPHTPSHAFHPKKSFDNIMDLCNDNLCNDNLMASVGSSSIPTSIRTQVSDTYSCHWSEWSAMVSVAEELPEERPEDLEGDNEALSQESSETESLQERGEVSQDDPTVPVLEIGCKTCEDQPCASFNSAVKSMVSALCASESCEEPVPPKIPDALHGIIAGDLGSWSLNLLRFAQLGNVRPLTLIGNLSVESELQALGIDASCVSCFFESIEARYNRGAPYHNSIHGADVMNSMIYFLRLQSQSLATIDPVQKLAAIVAAGVHDVGHGGFANAFQISAQTPLAMLYNDQSVLENMHCTITSSVLQADGSNFLKDMDRQARVSFRSCMIHMILETDLSKHIQIVSRFRQEFCNSGSQDQESTPVVRKELLSFMLKCCDVAHSTKPFDVHILWTLRINTEFFEQGDTEKKLDLPCSPFCDRTRTHISESQRGFFDFIVSPLYTAINLHLNSRRLEMEVFVELEKNRAFWNMYDGANFNYKDPQSNEKKLTKAFRAWDMRDQSVHSVMDACRFTIGEDLDISAVESRRKRNSL